MKQIESYTHAEKYRSSEYEPVSEGIFLHQGEYVTCLSFQLEPEYGEGENAADISQYPFEDILDRFLVYVSDFFAAKNTASSSVCYLEFSGSSLEDILELRSIIGKHVYNREKQSDGKTVIELVIE